MVQFFQGSLRGEVTWLGEGSEMCDTYGLADSSSWEFLIHWHLWFYFFYFLKSTLLRLSLHHFVLPLCINKKKNRIDPAPVFWDTECIRFKIILAAYYNFKQVYEENNNIKITVRMLYYEYKLYVWISFHIAFIFSLFSVSGNNRIWLISLSRLNYLSINTNTVLYSNQ